jgi:BR serine/threonine kinase
VILFALLAGKLPFDDPAIRMLLSKVKAGRFTMPSQFDHDTPLPIPLMLNVDVDQRITIGGIKSHPALTRGLPEGYLLPTPIRLTAWTEPIGFMRWNVSRL